MRSIPFYGPEMSSVGRPTPGKRGCCTARPLSSRFVAPDKWGKVPSSRCGSFLGSIEPHEELEESNKLSIRLARTRSRIVALPGHDPKTIRGFSSPRLIVVDEAAFVLDETYAALVPMLAASPEGRIALLSTPFLQQGFFYAAWHGFGNWERYEVPSRDCPRISATWLEERRREDPLKFAREYECSWSAGADCLFSDELLNRITRDDYELFPAF